MPLSWNEIKSRATAFSRNWADAGNEDSQAKPFLIDFLEVFGITDKSVASFEHAVEKHGAGRGYVDLFWPGISYRHSGNGKVVIRNPVFSSVSGFRVLLSAAPE
jgi:hypothetical protein